jgi:hypothetical protein
VKNRWNLLLRHKMLEEEAEDLGVRGQGQCMIDVDKNAKRDKRMVFDHLEVENEIFKMYFRAFQEKMLV